jgi:hypothetical protein
MLQLDRRLARERVTVRRPEVPNLEQRRALRQEE